MFGNKRGPVMGNSREPAPDQGTPNTLANVGEARFLGGDYFDVDGRKITAVVMEFGGQYWMPPNAVEWSAAMRPCAKWLNDSIKKKIEPQAPAKVPDKDAVDVL